MPYPYLGGIGITGNEEGLCPITDYLQQRYRRYGHGRGGTTGTTQYRHSQIHIRSIKRSMTPCTMTAVCGPGLLLGQLPTVKMSAVEWPLRLG